MILDFSLKLRFFASNMRYILTRLVQAQATFFEELDNVKVGPPREFMKNK